MPDRPKKTMVRLLRLFALLGLFCQASAQNPDIDLLKRINLERNRNLDGGFTVLSGSVAPLGLALPLGIAGAGLVAKNPDLQRKGLEMGAAVLVNTGLTLAVKYTVARPRPYVTYPALDNTTTEGSPSFPSGHTSFAFATATSLTLNFPKWYVAVPAYLWAGGVGYSRMHLGVHYPTDVLAGAITGAGSAWLTHRAQRWLTQKRQRRPSKP